MKEGISPKQVVSIEDIYPRGGLTSSLVNISAGFVSLHFTLLHSPSAKLSFY